MTSFLPIPKYSSDEFSSLTASSVDMSITQSGSDLNDFDLDNSNIALTSTEDWKSTLSIPTLNYQIPF